MEKPMWGELRGVDAQMFLDAMLKGSPGEMLSVCRIGGSSFVSKVATRMALLGKCPEDMINRKTYWCCRTFGPCSFQLRKSKEMGSMLDDVLNAQPRGITLGVPKLLSH